MCIVNVYSVVHDACMYVVHDACTCIYMYVVHDACIYTCTMYNVCLIQYLWLPYPHPSTGMIGGGG